MSTRHERQRRSVSIQLLLATAMMAFGIAGADPLELQTTGPAVANAGEARGVMIGEIVTLDGSGSTHADGDRLKFRWILHTPDGSGARLSDPTAVRPQFRVDLLGDYRAELIVNDGRMTSAPATVRYSTANVAPVADAGADRTIHAGETILLDASGSSDANGDILRYRWTVRDAPADSRAALGAETAVTTSFTADRNGDYLLELVASDGRLQSAPAFVRLSSIDSRPQSDAGLDRHIVAGATIRLDGRESSDVDGSRISHSWSLLHTPAHSAAALDHASSERPVLRTDVPGLYIAQLIVSDGKLSGEPDTVVIEAHDSGFAMVQQSPPSRAGGGGLDTDGDGVPDDIDNCAEDSNPTQLDSNGDGFGNACDADLDNDGFITNFGDLVLLKQAFISNPSSPNWNPDADFNGDELINFGDLVVMKRFFLSAPGPIAITFINPAGGDWHDPSNWSPPVVPNTTHTVRIDLAPGVTVEYSTGTSEIAGLRATSPVLISGGELSIDGDAQFNATLTLQTGATLANANILAPVAVPAPDIEIPASQSVTFDGVTLGADATVEAGATLTLLNGLTLSGGATITLASNNAFTGVHVSGASGAVSTIGGTGEIVFGGTSTVDNRNRVLVITGGHGLTIGSNVTIRTGSTGGRVAHNSANGPITLQGSVISDLANRVITIDGFPLTIEGSLQTQTDGDIEVTFGGVGSSITSAATISVNTGEIELFGDFTTAGTITVTNGVLDIGNAVGQEWSNTGSITMSNSTVELGGSFQLADVGTFTGTGTTVLNGTFDNVGMSVDLAAVLPGTFQFGTGAVVMGGSLVGAALTVAASQSVTFDGVTLGADVTAEPGATITLLNGLTLSGGATITLASNNAFTGVHVSGASGAVSTIGGTGEIVFGGTSTVDNRNRVLVITGGHGLTIGSNVTIRTGSTGGRVAHNSANGPITLQGSVISDLANRVITIDGFPLTIEGSLQTQTDGDIEVTFGGVGSSITSAATISVNTGEIELFGDFTTAGTITVTNGVLDIGNAVGQEWSNTGSITMSNSTVELGGSFQLADVGTFTGTGTTVVNGVFDNTGMSVDLVAALPGTVQFGSGAVVMGGSLVGAALTVPASQLVSFDGVTLGADVTAEAGATITLLNGLTLSGGATITLASNNAFTGVHVSGASGAVSTIGGTGEIVFGGTSTVDNRNRVLVITGGHGLTIGSNVTIRTGSTGGRVAHNSANGPITLQGSVISDLANRVITIDGFPLTIEGSLQTQTDGDIEVTFGGVGSSITSAATISVNTGEIELFGDFTTAGTITVTNGVLDIGNAVGQEWSNTGSITMSNSTVELGGSFQLADVGTFTGTGTTVVNGVFDNTGMSVDLVAALPGTVQFGSGAVVMGGSLVGAALTVPASQLVSFDGVTLGADVTAEAGATITLLNGLTLSGGATITLASNNAFTGVHVSGASGAVSTIGGTGEIVFGGTSTVDNRNRVLVITGGHGLTIGSNVTIRTGSTGGRVAHNSANGPITLQGSVISDLANRVITIGGFPLTIEGSLHAGAGSKFSLGEYTLAHVATLEVEIGGSATSDFGQFTGTTGNLDGTLDIAIVNGFGPAFGETFEIMTFGTARNNTFATVTGTGIGGGLFFQVNYNASDVTLEVQN